MKTRMRSILLALAAVMVFASTPHHAEAADKVTLSFSNWQWTEAGKNDDWRKLLTEFKQSHPDISFEEVAVPFDRYEDTLYTRWAGGEGPDLVVVNDSMIAKAIQLGLQPLDGLIDIGAHRASFSKLVDMAVKEGKTYGFVTEAVVRALLYNPVLFRQAGLDPNQPPKTIDEFRAACVKLKALGPDILGYGVRNSLDQWSGMYSDFTAWVYGQGGRWAVNGKPTITAPENLKALEEFKKVYDSGCMSRGVPAATYRKAFGIGKVGMMIDNSAMINIYRKDSPTLEVRTAVSPFPQIKTQAEILFVGISKAAKHPKEAAAFINWFMQSAVYQKWLESINTPTGGLKQSVSQAWLSKNPWVEPFLKAAEAGSTSVAPEGLEQYTAQFKQIVTKHLEQVLVANRPAKDELAAAQTEVEDLIKRSK
jgi:multiple sugar transport system substrate-binding protein